MANGYQKNATGSRSSAMNQQVDNALGGYDAQRLDPNRQKSESVVKANQAIDQASIDEAIARDEALTSYQFDTSGYIKLDQRSKVVLNEPIAPAYTIGYRRDDGEIGVVAAFVNNDEMLRPEMFRCLTNMNLAVVQACLGEEYDVVMIPQQEVPDYIDIEQDDSKFEADIRRDVAALRDAIMNDARYAKHNSDSISMAARGLMDIIDKIGA